MRFPSLLLALAILAGCPRRAAPPTPSADDALGAYAESPYGYCDAIALSAHWGLSVWETKTRIGQKVLQGQDEAMATELASAFFNADKTGAKLCTFEDVLAPSDAEPLAALWGVPTDTIYKLVDDKLARGLHNIVEQEARLARDKFDGTTDPMQDKFADFERAWGRSGYAYCDAKLLASIWEMSNDPHKAKLTAGQKLLMGDDATVDSYLQTARSDEYTVPCAWHELPLSYRDAEAMAQHWGTDIDDAKTRLARAYTRPTWPTTRSMLDSLSAPILGTGN